MINPPRLILILAAVSCLLLAASACGDDDDPGATSTPTLEGYFSSLETIFIDFSAKSASIRADHHDAFDKLDDTEAYYQDLLAEMQQAYADIAALSAPQEIATLHQALVEATQDFYTEVLRVNDEVTALDDDAALAKYTDDLQTDPALTLTATAVTDACHALQRYADDNNVDTDLLCGKETDPTEAVILEQYFISLSKIFDDADAATTEAQTTLDEATSDATFEEQKTAIDAYLTDIRGIFTDTLNRLRAHSTPDAVADAQADFITAVEDMLDSASAFQQNLPNIEDAEHLDTRRADFGDEISTEVTRADDACTQLQRIAEGRSIDVDLGCSD